MFDGILLVDKPAGPTSHDIVHKIRKTFRIPKVGHGGTLDPAATGLLPILLGKGTKLSEQLMASNKSYRGTIRLGISTSTQDAAGEILAERPWEEVTAAALETAMQSFRGDIFQIPPMVSAVKVGGVPLYKMARRGQEIERKPRLVHIFRFVLENFAPPLADFEVICTKGTYVRTLAHDIGEALGCGAHLQALCRTRTDPFELSQATPFDTIITMTPAQLSAKVISIADYTKR